MRAYRELLISLLLSLVLHGVVLLERPVLGRGETDGYAGLPAHSRLLARLVVDQTVAAEAPVSVVDKAILTSSSLGLERGEGSVKIQDGIEQRSILGRSIDEYLPPSMLDLLPRLLDDVDMAVDFRGMEGVVGEAEVLLLISSAGRVDGVHVVASSLPGFVVEAITERFGRARFSPGEVRGVQVRSRLRIRFSPPSADEMLGNPTSAKERVWKR